MRHRNWPQYQQQCLRIVATLETAQGQVRARKQANQSESTPRKGITSVLASARGHRTHTKRDRFHSQTANSYGELQQLQNQSYISHTKREQIGTSLISASVSYQSAIVLLFVCLIASKKINTPLLFLSMYNSLIYSSPELHRRGRRLLLSCSEF